MSDNNMDLEKEIEKELVAMSYRESKTSIIDWVKLLAAVTALITALSSGLVGLYIAYESSDKTDRTSEKTDVGYTALVAKINAIAEKVAYLEGLMSSRRNRPRLVYYSPTTTNSDPISVLPRDGLGIASPDTLFDARTGAPKSADAGTDKPELPKPADAYKQLPLNLETLVKQRINEK